MYLSLVWHFHQPIYKDASTGEYILPWVNFHATKNYYQLGKLVQETGFPCAFNFVPCLLEQLMEYAAGTAKDPFQRALEKDPRSLSPADVQLLRKIVPDGSDPARAQAEALQAMFSPLQKPEKDKAGLLALQKEIHKDLVPLFKRLRKSSLVELFTSPYYHPLLPLVFDSHCPTDEKLPSKRFRHPEDGMVQLRKGREYFRKIFGFDPDGLWPSEGGISREVAAAIAEADFRFAFTDENVLWKSLKEPYDRQKLYRPYKAENLSLFFRDRELADLLSFEYKKLPAAEAVTDFLLRLEDRRKTSPEDSICVVVLDGENPWEGYPENGVPFLREFFARLLKADGITPIFPGEYLKNHPPTRELTLVPGTWLGNFSKWIGDPAKNKAWDELAEVRDQSGPNEEIYVAEGSDWFWWYGEPDKGEFDVLFKGYLREALRKTGAEERT